MRTALKFLVWTVTLSLACITAAANFRYGWLVATGWERYVYAFGGTVLDVVKTFLPTLLGTFLVGPFTPGLFCRTVAGWAVWLLLVVWSVTCALGLYAITKEARVGDTKGMQAEYQRLTENQERKRARLMELSSVRPAELVEGEIAALKRDRIWTRTRECTDATVQESRDHCAKIDRLTAELATAPRAEDVAKETAKLRADLQEIEQQLAGMDMADVFKKADPATEALAKLTGLEPENVKTILALMIALGLETGGLLPWLTLGQHVPGQGAPSPANTQQRSREREPSLPISDQPEPEQDPSPAPKPEIELPEEDGLVARWAKESLVRRRGTFTLASDAWADFESWCHLNNVGERTNQTAFGKEMTRLSFGRKKVGGKQRYVDIALRPKSRELKIVEGGLSSATQ